MINLVTAPPGVGKTLYATMQLIKAHELNQVNLPKARDYYIHNLELLAKNLDKKIVVDLVEFKGNQNLFAELRLALQAHDGQEITLDEYFSCFNHYDFSDFYSDKVTPEHYFLSTSYNLIANFVNKAIGLSFKMIPPVRQIYSDINGLRVDDVLESPDDWRTCPDGSIIFYDEVQNRSIYKNTKAKNEIIEDLTVHRHRGFDIWFITQFPILIHTEVRAVVGQHYHLFRPWGLPQAYVHVWSYAVVDPNSFSKKRAAERTFRFSYPKKVFKMYTSSTMHTHKIHLPKKLILYAFGIGLGLVMMYRGFSGGTIFNEGTDTVKPETLQTSGLLDKVDNAKQSNPYAQSTLSLECRKAANVEKPECVKWFNDLSNNKSSVSSTGAVVQAVSYNPNKPYDFDYQPQVQPTDFPKMSGVIKLRNGQLMAVDQQGNYMQNISQNDCRRWLDGYRPFNYFAQQKQSTERVSTSESGNQNLQISSL
ncbi:zonular occludens toxin domain-containing protein [Acinetobacter sp.]|uniref:zonular occludens toxin domain-containing protein n=1 Tax=Acinetobacter sp. TaxID=472 RepID=UPI002FC73DBC